MNVPTYFCIDSCEVRILKHRQFLRGTFAAICMGILILDSKTALSGALEGVQLCIQSLIPSLFPFMVASSLLTGSFMGTDNLLLRPFGKLLGIPEGCESLLIPAFLGGYPAGAQCIGQTYRQGSITREQALGMLLFCSNAGPSFLFGLLGPMFPQRQMLWSLWGIHIVCALLCGWIFSPKITDNGVITVTELSFSSILSASVRTMGTVCGWVVLFRVVLSFCRRWFLWMLPPTLQIIVTGVLELSNGCLALPLISDEKLRFVIASGLLAFGGLCVVMQTAAVIGELSVRSYCCGKILHGFLSTLLSIAICYRKPVIPVILLLLCVLLKKTVAIRGTMVYNGPITIRRNPYAVSKENRPRLRILSPGHDAGRGQGPVQQKRNAFTG